MKLLEDTATGLIGKERSEPANQQMSRFNLPESTLHEDEVD